MAVSTSSYWGAMLAKWALRIGVHLERRWTLPSKLQSLPETEWAGRPHSGGYYHVTAAYFSSGALNKIQNLAGLPTITYGLDSIGRTQTVSASTGTNPVSNTLYNTARTGDRS